MKKKVQRDFRRQQLMDVDGEMARLVAKKEREKAEIEAAIAAAAAED